MSSKLRLPKPLSHPWYCHVLTTVTLFCPECPNSSRKNLSMFKIVLPDPFSRPLNALMHPHLTKLPWLLIAQRIEYKVSSMCYDHDVVSETAPPYLSDLLHLYIPSLSLYSSADTRTFWIPKWKKKFLGQHTFSDLGLLTWNKLPYPVCYAATKSQFKTQKHKTTLFLSAHGPNS